MLYLGCHLSSSGGFKAMGEAALKLNANTFQFFLRNPRGGAAKEINQEDIKAFLKLASEYKFGKVLAHAPYTLNPCSKDESTRNFAREVFADDIRCLRPDRRRKILILQAEFCGSL
jgi:deoxyribonuclease-4